MTIIAGNGRVPASPCFGCGERQAGCHGTCERYRAWADLNAEDKAKYRHARAQDRECENYKHDNRERLNKLLRLKGRGPHG